MSGRELLTLRGAGRACRNNTPGKGEETREGGEWERACALHSERALRVAVVVGVALEALAERVVAVAEAAVRALRDVSERARRRRRELDDLHVARGRRGVPEIGVGDCRAV